MQEILKECKRDGILSKEILTKIPGRQMEEVRKAKGPVVVIECAENIPCNPCETSCPQHAISIGDNITNLPHVDISKCVGCGLCVAVCPGLAIFVIDAHYAPERASIMFAYEYLPVPEKGEKVIAVDRAGKRVCEAIVEKVVAAKTYDMTRVITISVPEEYIDEVRGIERKKGDE